MQNNSRNKASKRGNGKGGAASKNSRAINAIFSDLSLQEKIGLETELPANIYIGRVEKKLGNGRMEVRYFEKERNVIRDKDGSLIDERIEYPIKIDQAVIRGSLRGKGKRSVWVDINSIVVIEDSGLGIMEIKALMTRDQLKDLAKEIYIHPQILSDQGSAEGEDDAIEFVHEHEPSALQFSDKDIDNI